jgi:hypothetical protein
VIKAEFVEDPHHDAADIVSAVSGTRDCVEQHVQSLFVVTSVQGSERRAEIQHCCLFKTDPGGKTIGCKASVNASEDFDSLFALTTAVEEPGQLDRSTGEAWLELEGGPERFLITLASQQLGLSWEERIEEVFHGRSRLSSDELSHHATVAKGFDRRNSLNPIRLRKSRVGVDVDLDEF